MDNINSVIGVIGCMLTASIVPDDLTTWVSVICSCAIALVTCGLQIYRMIKNRDKEETKDEDNKDNETE